MQIPEPSRENFQLSTKNKKNHIYHIGIRIQKQLHSQNLFQ